MNENYIGVAVIGAGMAGKAHAAGYRAASAIYKPTLPPIRLVAVADINEALASEVANRYGFDRHDADWRAIADDDSIHVVSVVVANFLHREIVETLLAAGKHVLCEKPVSDTLADARAMADAAEKAESIARVGFTFRRAPGVALIKQLVDSGDLGDLLHFSGRYWTEYACWPDAPMSWRYQGPPGSGALGDVGSHLSDVAEFICGQVTSVTGGHFYTSITERPKPLGAVIGHTRGNVSDELVPVENEDYAAFTMHFDQGIGALEVSRVAAGHPTSLFFEIFGTKGAARWDQRRASEVQVLLEADEESSLSGYRTVQLGPDHPYVGAGIAMDAPGMGIGHNDLFVFQARAFLEEVAGLPDSESLPRCASFDEGVHNIRLLDAVAESASRAGARVPVATS